MGWKGTLRAIETEIRRSAREAERRRKHTAKIQSLEDADNAVRAFEEYIQKITSVHKSRTTEVIDWKQGPPSEPTRSNGNEAEAKYKYENFKPNFFHKLLKSENKKRERLRRAIEELAKVDEMNYQRELEVFRRAHQEWERKNSLAKRLLAKEPQAFTEAIKKYNPFASIEILGSGVQFSVNEHGDLIADIIVHSDDVIPKEKYSLRQSGTLSTKNMPKGEFNELYQDYVCGCALRVATEFFAMLPIERVLVNANDNLLNPQTGHVEKQTILSVIIMRKTLERINLTCVDPSDSMKNFLHNMKFKKATGFESVEPLTFSALKQA